MNNKIILSHHVKIDIPFFDVDSMNIVWHGNYVKYLEIARCALLDKLQYNYIVMKQQGYAWPVVKMDLKYIRPIYFNQKIKVIINLLDYETCLKCSYEIIDAQSMQKLTLANTTQVALSIETQEMQFQTPDSFRNAVLKYLNTYMGLEL